MRDGQLNPDEQKADKLVTINIEGNKEEKP